jgi:hypothetical protein
MKLKLYQYTWVEMSGGFDCGANIMASNQEKADEIFMKNIAVKHFAKPELARQNISCTCIHDTYKEEYIAEKGLEYFKRGLPIHFTEDIETII